MNEQIHCCRIKDESENTNITDELLNALELAYSSWIDKEENTAFHTIYTEDEESAQSVSYLLETQLKDWQEFGVKVTEIKVLSIEKKDWTEVWKAFFKIEHVSERLVVKPSWLEYEPKEGQIIIEIDPGMSFGTGRHATTRFCLKMLDKLADLENPQSVMDAGCGSGILSIGAAKLKYAPIKAFDIDPDAIKVSTDNFEINKISEDLIDLFVSDFDAVAEQNCQYDIVVANILSHILVKNRQILFDMVKPGGYLILAGILEQEYANTRNQFQELGLKEIETSVEAEWQGGLFKKDEERITDNQ